MKILPESFINEKPEKVLKQVFGYDSFRPLQKEIITSILQGKDALGVMPTGGGKSICYQLPALIFPGITVVVSPLISLMHDQVASLEATGIHSVFLNSSLEWEEYLTAVEEIKKGEVKILYVSPEGLSTGKIRDLLSSEAVKISCITIDEAHCISEWGHDFRPDYLEISSIRNLFPNAVMLALTATATEQVRQDIIKNLRLKDPAVFISSFDRENIFLEVQPKRSGLEQVIACIKKHIGDSGIIYCNSRKQTDDLTSKLDKLGYSVLNYHAGLPDSVRAANQDKFIKDQVQIIVATVAFGMGIDKPNVRFVINYDLPKSLAEYYQEIGRAGRDGLPSDALLLYSPADIHKIRYFFQEAADPQKSEILLQGMIQYASSHICRRKQLLAYFGEKYTAPDDSEATKEACCDICRNGTLPLKDVTIPAQKLMSCIIRTRQRFGATYVIDVLTGARNKRIIENGHDQLSTWNIGDEFSKDGWFELLDLLIAEQLVVKTGDYNILEITPSGKAFLTNRSQLQLPMSEFGSMKFAKKTSQRKITSLKPAADDEYAEKIIESLKKWRKRKADDMNVPPYVIFGDKTILDIAAKKPANKGELLNVYGIGSAKAEEFGRALLEIVAEVCQA
ncbi:MAG: DNA helicase RecQ [Treponema sp.]|nr:DNA helicase RecQ [Treponema sp.]